MRTFILRDFADYNENGNAEYSDGTIELSFITDNFIEVLICGLHDAREGIQAKMLIKYASDLDIYDTINTILYKISYDLYYISDQVNQKHKDFICHCHAEFKNTEVWNYDRDKTSVGYIWLPFTRENIVHITTSNPETYHKLKNDNYPHYVIRGNVDENGVFTYDFPIVDTSCSKKDYKKSRGIMNYFYGM